MTTPDTVSAANDEALVPIPTLPGMVIFVIPQPISPPITNPIALEYDSAHTVPLLLNPILGIPVVPPFTWSA